MSRESIKSTDLTKILSAKDSNESKPANSKLYSSLAVPSYVHGYSLGIQYMYNWFSSKFDKDYFKGGIYIDGKHVLDDYKQLSKNVVKGQKPRARMAPTVEYDYDRENIDNYLFSPEIYLRKCRYQDCFFKDYEKSMFLGLCTRAMRMDFNFKVQVNTRAQQLDLFNKMELAFRVGATQYNYISVDFQVPKDIMNNLAYKAGFELNNNGEVKNIIEFINYLNSHSELPFLFKMRAINQKPEYFIRVPELYTHIACKDKLQMDDGERDGKLDFNFHVEMNATLTMPIPYFYSFYSGEDPKFSINVKEDNDVVAIYSINVLEIPNTNEKGWIKGAITDYATDKGDTEIDMSSIFCDGSRLMKAISHDLTRGISPKHFMDIVIYKDYDASKLVNFEIDWKNKKIYFDKPRDEEILHIAIYYDREYINELDIELNNLKNSRISNS